MTDSKPTVKLYLDTRRPKTDGTYPVKICIYKKGPSKDTSKAKYYPTSISLTEAEYKEVQEKHPKNSHYKSIKNELEKERERTTEETEFVQPFSFEAYEELREREKKIREIEGSKHNVFWHYDERIRNLKELKQIGNASWYECSKKSLQRFLEHQKDRKPDRLNFDRITPKWLRQYEFFMTESGKSKTTIAMYLRALRAVFVDAIKAGYIDRSQHPFGEGKYELKEGGKVKKALSREDLITLCASEPATPEQQKAKDFWFFSYLCNGMNVKDIINLRYGQIGKNSFVFERIKTKNTNRQSQPIQVILNDHVRYVIQQYGNQSTGRPKQLVFPILSDNDSAERQHMKTQAFTRFINQHIKKLAMANGITGDISTYYARHTWASLQLQNGTPPGFIQGALGHSSIMTTEKYLHGFPTEEKERIAQKQYEDLPPMPRFGT